MLRWTYFFSPYSNVNKHYKHLHTQTKHNNKKGTTISHPLVHNCTIIIVATSYTNNA